MLDGWFVIHPTRDMKPKTLIDLVSEKLRKKKINWTDRLGQNVIRPLWPVSMPYLGSNFTYVVYPYVNCFYHCYIIIPPICINGGA